MICHIVACGTSGRHWNGQGFAIGVNDCLKYGQNVDILLIVNSLNSFPDRKKIVEETRPRLSLMGIGCWNDHPNYTPVPYMNSWNGRIEKGKIYKSKTSPFIAATLAFKLGYDKIVLWGVDLIDHPIVKGWKKDNEVRNFVSLHKALQKRGASLYLGATEDFTNEGALSLYLPNFRIL